MNIFISHNHQDKEFVRRLSSDLGTGGFSVWIDEDMISAGEKWTDRITDALDRSDVIIVVLSSNSSNSKFQSSEIAYALASQRKSPSKKIIPIVLDKKAELPFFLKDVVYVDFSSPEKYKERFEYLEKALSSPRLNEPDILSSDQRKIEAIKAEKEYLQAESKNLDSQRAILSSTVLGVVASIISTTVALVVGAAASAKWIGVFFQEWGGFVSGLLVGVFVTIVAFVVSKRVQRKTSDKEVGNG